MTKNTWKKECQDLSLLDEEFLATLCEQKEREIYARIASLDINENPIDQIEGKVTGGSINIDGTSAVRRTCSLTMVSDQVDINDYYWGLKTKFKLEIGLRNNLSNEYQASADSLYPDIIWFPQGIYLITGFNTSIATNNCTISVSGKDKICMLNGELGGQLFASIDFGTEETEYKIMNKATITAESSDVLMKSKYYFQPTSIANYPNEIADNDSHYVFILNNRNGPFFKWDNLYIKVDGNNVRGNRYDIYELLTSPSTAFEVANVTDRTYTPGTYYCKKYASESNPEGYFALSSKSKMESNTTYYSLITLYELEYEHSIKKIPLEKIIKESVHAYALEPYHNIIINDLDDYGLEQITYKGDIPLFVMRNYQTRHFTNIRFSNKMSGSITNAVFTFTDEDTDVSITINGDSFKWDTLTPEIDVSSSVLHLNTTNNSNTYTLVNTNSSAWQNATEDYKKECYTIAKIRYGQDLGYRVTDLTYTGDLISSIGESLSSVLDKIKTMLGDFEYFYDNDGHFVFQRKRIYVNTSWSQLTDNDDEIYVNYANGDRKKFSFNFEGNRLISAIQNSPVLTNLKNDFIVWGKRKSISGTDIPIHARYAIDKKPKEYLSLKGILYYTEEALTEASPEFANIIQENQDTSLLNFQKDIDIIPSFLRNPNDNTKSDWWEVSNWAQYYFLITGAYPSQMLMQYGTVGFAGSIRFPNGTTRTLTNQLIIDLSRSTSNPLTTRVDRFGRSSSWSPFQHGFNGCGHTYEQYLGWYDTYPDMVSFIYKPHIPTSVEEDGGTMIDSLHDHAIKVDWRELIYQMALDYFQGQGCSEQQPIYNIDGEKVLTDPDHFLPTVAANNPSTYPTGYTGYEQYYTDMEGFWRQLYNPYYTPEPIYTSGEYKDDVDMGSSNIYYKKVKLWQGEKLSDYKIEYYFGDNLAKNITQYSELETYYAEHQNEEDVQQLYAKYRNYYISQGADCNQEDFMQKRLYWNVNVWEAPETLNFWIDFLDDTNELAAFSVPMVGDRTKVVNEDKANAIIYKEVPDLILYDKFKDDSNDTEADLGSIRRDVLQTDNTSSDDLRDQIIKNSGYTFIYLPKGFSQFLTMSYRNMSVKNKIDELIYSYAYCIENVSITALPIYHLQPNTRIYVRDETTNINGEYIVSKLTIPLNYNGTMSITATKAPERLY